MTSEQNGLFCKLLFQDEKLETSYVCLQLREQQPSYTFEGYWGGYLQKSYAEYAEKYVEVYGDLPHIGRDFTCEYVDFPKEINHDDAEGITIVRGTGTAWINEILDAGIPQGIYINSRLRGFRGTSLNVLLHEMIHASGVPNHGEEFYKKLDRLYSLGAFRNSIL